MESQDPWFKAISGWREMPWSATRRKLVLLVPHPEEDVFDYSDLVEQCSAEASETLIIYVKSRTSQQTCMDADEHACLARMRRLTSEHALDVFKIGTPVRVRELDIGSSTSATFKARLEYELQRELDCHAIVIAPSYLEGHVEHIAVGKCVRHLAAKIGFEVHFYPIKLYSSSEAIGGESGLRSKPRARTKLRLHGSSREFDGPRLNRHPSLPFRTSAGVTAAAIDEFKWQSLALPPKAQVH
jgi:hypothetical protein